MERTGIRILVVFNLIAFLSVVAVNGLANALPINGRNTGEISNSLPNLFVPAGITFSIWAVIYLLLGIWAVWQLVAVFGGNSTGISLAGRIGIWFILSSLANIGWILAWHYGRLTLSMLLMLVLLASLIAVYLRLGIGRSNPGLPARYTALLPFSIYLGWITVATVANFTAVLVAAGWRGFGMSDEFWAIVMITATLLITLMMLVSRRDLGFSLVILWALFGIVLARLNGTEGSRIVAVAASAAGVVVIAGILVVFLRKRA